MIDLKKAFESVSGEYLKFDRIANPMHQRPDICAFLMLDRLVPGTGDMVSSANNDELYLDTDLDQLAKFATQEDITYLVRCGVRLCNEYDCLCMFV